MISEAYVSWLRLVAKHMAAVVGGFISGVILAVKPSKGRPIQALRIGWLVFFIFVAGINALRNLREGSKSHCIWTQLEQILRIKAGLPTYDEPFIEHYFKIPQGVMGMIGGVLFFSVLTRFLKSRH